MEKIFTKRNIKIFNWIIAIIMILIFEFGYCNVSFTAEYVKNGQFQHFYFSLCRGVMYAAILLTIFFINRSKIIEEISKSFESKTKKVIMITYIFISFVFLFVYLYRFFSKRDIPFISFSLLLMTFIAGFSSVMYLTKKYTTNLIAFFLLGLIFSFTVNGYHIFDEKKHFMSAYNLSYGNIHFDKPIIDKQFMEDLPRGTHYSNLVKYFSVYYKFEKGNLPTEYTMDSTPTTYNPILYVPSALGILTGRVLKGSIADILLMGRIFNLICYMGLIILTLKILPYKKNTFFIVLTVPMLLCFSATYSIDGIGTAIVLLFIAYVLKVYENKETITVKNLVIISILFTILLMYKSMSYILVGLLLLLLPWKQIFKKYKKQSIIILILFILVNIVILKLQPQIDLSDTRYEGVNATEQIRNGIHHPLLILDVMKNLLESTILNFSWLQHFNSNLYFSKNSACLLIIMAIYYFYIALKDDEKNLNKKEKTILLISFLLTYYFIGGIFYVACSPVGANYVLGYQARYLFPIMPLVLMCISNKTLKSRENNLTIKSSFAQILFIFLDLIGSILR